MSSRAGAAAAGAVTVVIPSKDRPALLAVTLASVLRQRAVELEVVVVDDGGAVPAQDPRAARDPRLRFVRHDRSRGVAAARNTGLAAASNPYVAFVDDDDVWAPDKLSNQLDALRRAPRCRWACSTAVPFYDDGSLGRLHRPPDDDDVTVALLRANVVPGGGSGVLASTALVRDVGGFDTRLSNLADWDCWLRLGQRSPVARVPSPDVGYRRHGTSMGHAVERSEAELAQMRTVHAALYERAGVDVDVESWRAYLNQLTYESGHWRDGVRGSWHLLRAHRHRRALLQPVRYAAPKSARRGHERVQAWRHPVQYAYARHWLREVLSLEPAGATSRDIAR